MPFIRYRIGDVGEWINGKCPCGCNLPLMKLHIGKATDIVVMKNGQTFSSEIFDYLNLALLDLNRQPFDQYQIIQTRPSTFTIRYVKSHNYYDSDLDLFQKLLCKTVHDDNIQIEFRPVTAIKPDQTGKMRYFISELKP
jgi:phenylacetate-CoA ligase